MKAIKPSYLREHQKAVFDMVAGGETVIIPRPENKNVVVVSEEEWNAREQALKSAEIERNMSEEHREYIRQALAEATERAKDPNTKWYSIEEVAEKFGVDL